MNDETRRSVLKAFGAGTMVAAGAGEAAAQEDESEARVFSAGVLSGEKQRPDPVDTDGFGAAVFRLAEDGSALDYALVVGRIENVTQAHIHAGGPEENGPVVAFLFGAQDDEGNFTGPVGTGVTETGLLAAGTVTADDLVGPLEGASLDELAGRMREGNAYANVHTVENPAGEIRAQVEEAGDDADVQLVTHVGVDATSDSINVAEQSVLQFGDTVVGGGHRGRDGGMGGGGDGGGSGGDGGGEGGGGGGEGGDGGGGDN